MLEIRDLHVEVDGKPILKGIDLTIRAGEVHAVMGPNGSGKSTLSHVLAGREGYTVTRGSVTFEGKDLLDVANFVAEKLSTLGGVLSTATRFQLKAYKQGGFLAQPAPDEDRLPVSP